MAEGICFLCGNWEVLERHHIFGGALRKKAEKYKLTVMLCPWCHQYDADSVHRSGETRRFLRQYGQRKAMKEQGWSREDFILQFGRNYLDEDEPDEEPVIEYAGVFEVIEGGPDLPW